MFCEGSCEDVAHRSKGATRLPSFQQEPFLLPSGCQQLKRKRNFRVRKKEKTENLKTQAGIGVPKPSVTEVKIV